MPFFVGRFDVDSTQVQGKWIRLATYPEGALAGAARTEFWAELKKYLPVEIAVFGVAPYDSYTNLLIFDEEFGGGSALEHQNSHVGIYTPQLIGNPVLPSITAHDLSISERGTFASADMVPYITTAGCRRPRFGPRGITDHYASAAGPRRVRWILRVPRADRRQDPGGGRRPGRLARGRPPLRIGMTDAAGLTTTQGIAGGMLLDIRIRAASGNQKSLDDVMRSLYRSTHEKGRGFTGKEWWAAVASAAGGASFEEFKARDIDGREPFPYAADFAMAGISFVVDSNRIPRVGIQTRGDSAPEAVIGMSPGSAFAAAGLSRRTGPRRHIEVSAATAEVPHQAVRPPRHSDRGGPSGGRVVTPQSDRFVDPGLPLVPIQTPPGRVRIRQESCAEPSSPGERA
jgi:hypothetical protein